LKFEKLNILFIIFNRITAFELHLSHPFSKQFLKPTGVPLYPAEINLQLLTTKAPTLRFIQLLLDFTIKAIFMKYRFQLGLKALKISKMIKILNLFSCTSIRSFYRSPKFLTVKFDSSMHLYKFVL